MYRVLLIRYFIPALVALAIAIPTAFAADAAGLPGGATSLRETYQAWQVACAVQDKTKHCALLQQQTEKNGLKVLTIQLTPAADRGASGTLILPFGLLLSSGGSTTSRPPIRCPSGPACRPDVWFRSHSMPLS